MKGRLPVWLIQKLPEAGAVANMDGLVRSLGLNTVCASALCPNLGQCFSRGTATFLILGSVCTRNCTFCAVEKGTPLPVDEQETHHLCEAVTRLGLSHVVVTSVTRDDLPDGGADQFARTIDTLHGRKKAITVEVYPRLSRLPGVPRGGGGGVPGSPGP